MSRREVHGIRPVGPARWPLGSRSAAAVMIAVALASPARLAALSTDAQQPLRIEADRVHVDEREGVSTYSGSVRLRQGSLDVRADTIVVYVADQRLDRVLAEGRPVTIRQLTDEQQLLEAEAYRMEYEAPQQMIILLESARLRQAGNEFASDRIEYDAANEILKAGSDAPDGGERVRITIQPPALEAIRQKGQ
jgi:lipopolysaccharide export system protein LptA